MSSVSRRHFWPLAVGLGAVLLAGLGGSDVAEARTRTRVVWSDVQLPAGDRSATRELRLRSVLKKESRRAHWGRVEGGTVEASLRVTEFAVEHRPDVLRVTCSAVGKLNGGPAVRTHFSFGGHPNKQDALETTVLTLVARGVVTRLAAVSRARSPGKE